ncbi:MAG: hypothetical protein HON53_02110 [Planctomycetaceae bacterium]|jgi:hypothetical protein|nr:hypothetical protein [Planctomycetaceae bacterium]MBT6154636.1 hypothetical protein [Planctomycetaceae bacterium]MBT6485371.1 hypothetical protein [Planctomycetaceae bacterium]MBT6495126.1 hypothetical protein [Planctomycetaceae bacterium]
MKRPFKCLILAVFASFTAADTADAQVRFGVSPGGISIGGRRSDSRRSSESRSRSRSNGFRFGITIPVDGLRRGQPDRRSAAPTAETAPRIQPLSATERKKHAVQLVQLVWLDMDASNTNSDFFNRRRSSESSDSAKWKKMKKDFAEAAAAARAVIERGRPQPPGFLIPSKTGEEEGEGPAEPPGEKCNVELRNSSLVEVFKTKRFLDGTVLFYEPKKSGPPQNEEWDYEAHFFNNSPGEVEVWVDIETTVPPGSDANWTAFPLTSRHSFNDISKTTRFGPGKEFTIRFSARPSFEHRLIDFGVKRYLGGKIVQSCRSVLSKSDSPD